MSAPAPPPDSILPWERRRELGGATAFIETFKLFFFSPAEAWRRTPASGRIEDPLLFAVVAGTIGMVFSALYERILPFGRAWMVPPALRHRFPAGHPEGPVALGCAVLLAPVLVAIGLLVWSVVFHVCLAIVGALRDSPGGFSTTIRVASYSAVATLANAVPFVGGLIGLGWGLYLNAKGAASLHRTSSGRAATAVLIPAFLLALLVLVGIAVAIAVFSASHTMSRWK